MAYEPKMNILLNILEYLKGKIIKVKIKERKRMKKRKRKKDYEEYKNK